MTNPKISLGDKVTEADFGLNAYTLRLDKETLYDHLLKFVKSVPKYANSKVLIDPTMEPAVSKEALFKSFFSTIVVGKLVFQGLYIEGEDILILSCNRFSEENHLLGADEAWGNILVRKDTWAFETPSCRVEAHFLISLDQGADRGGFHIVNIYDK
jgi:hypothetical protein